MAQLLLLTACANVDVSRVTSYNQHGIRFWRPAPYVALAPKTDGKITTCEAKLVMLPDKSEEYAITMSTGLRGNAETHPQLQDGWNLTGLDAKADSKTAEVLNAFAAVIKSAYPGDGKSPSATNGPAQKKIAGCDGLYRVEFDQYGHADKFVYVPYAFDLTKPTPSSSGITGQKPSPGGLT